MSIRMIPLRFGTLSILSLLTTFACTTQKIIISGQMISSTGTPISQVEIKTEPRTDFVTTDQNGYFFIARQVSSTGEKPKDIPPNTYRLLASKDGFTTLEFSISAEKGDVWSGRQILHEEKPLVNPIAPEGGDHKEVTPNHSGGVVGY